MKVERTNFRQRLDDIFHKAVLIIAAFIGSITIAGAQEFTVEPGSFNYGDVAVGSESSSAFDVRNDGTKDLVVYSIVIQGSAAQDFVPGFIEFPFTLAPDGETTLNVSFRPTASGQKSARLRIVSNDMNVDPLDVNLSGNGFLSSAHVNAVVVPDKTMPLFDEAVSVAVDVDAGDQLITIYEAALCWDPAVLEFTSAGAGDEPWDAVMSASEPYIPSADTACIDFIDSAFDGVSGQFTVANLNFKVIGTAGFSTPLDLQFKWLASEEFSNLLDRLSVDGGSVLVEGEDFAISVDPSELDFGVVEIGWDAFQSLTVRNTGKNDLTLGPLTVSGPDADQFFVEGGEGLVLAPGQIGEVQLRFNPGSTGVKNADLQIDTSYPGTATTVSLTGEGSPDPVADIAIEPDGRDFGRVNVNADSVLSLVVYNDGNLALDATATQISGQHQGLFTIVSGQAPFSVAPDGSHTIEVQFAPDSTGSKNATLEVTCNDPDENPAKAALTGRGINPPDIAITPASHDFGEHLLGTVSSHSLTLSNQGTGTLFIDLTGVQGDGFALDAGDITRSPLVYPGQSRNLGTYFNPTRTGAKSGQVLLVTNDPDTIVFDVPLAGSGFAEPDIAAYPKYHDFANVVVGSTVTQLIQVLNRGTGPLSVENVILTGPDSDQFILDTGGISLPMDLEVGGRIDAWIEFAPSVGGFKEAELAVSSDDPDTNPLVIPVSGSGLDSGGSNSLVLNPSDDAYVSSSFWASRNYGSNGSLIVRDSWIDNRSFLKFSVSGLSGPVASAKLRLYATNGSADGGSLYETDSAWDEGSITWNNAPALEGAPVHSAGAIGGETWVEFDVSTAVNGDGTYSFGILNGSSDNAVYSSKEGSDPPELVFLLPGGNALPVATDDTAETNEDTAVEIEVIANDTDDDGFIVQNSVIVRQQPVYGVAEFNPETGLIIYTPATNFYGSDQFTYTVRDDYGATSNEAVVEVTVYEVNDPPVAVDDETVTSVDLAVDIDVLANDSDIDGTLDPASVVVIDPPQYGVTSVDPMSGAVTYTPDPGIVETDYFSYTVADEDGGTSNEAYVTVIVTGGVAGGFTFETVADATVGSFPPWTNYGTDGTLRVQDSWLNDFKSFLKFDISGVTGVVIGAKLRLYVTDASSNGGSIYRVGDNSWTETDINWSNAPALDGAALAAADEVSNDTWVEIDVTSVIDGDGTYSFAIGGGSSDAAAYSAREGTNPPQLVIETLE